ncbi:hypothetical protein P154DRAFT_557593 [Amniculicola lignicola CBS 123094]|uniref:PD-(D/E)XK nuclease-like domain-containing protein n=1 Tax=Amniculicola lignicola CBS 123094 TaxID=1392246 RepID=A0A6A5VW32_9PLEO|nr:hypothetical protein P154DRAFT_557593 [Amniculicola lignicola CBS 123094]
MSPKSISDIAVWVDNVNTLQELPSSLPIVHRTTDDEENPRSAKKRRKMECDLEQTLRDLNSASHFAPPSPTKSASSTAASETSEAESHQSGRLSPVKQLQMMEDFEEQPVVFCNFDDDEDVQEPLDVMAMRRAIQRFADGVGILGYGDCNAFIHNLPPVDKMRFQYPWANDPEHRCVFGSMPSTAQVLDIVATARKYDHGSGVSEEEWNSEVQHPLLKLARSTSKHRQTLEIHNV